MTAAFTPGPWTVGEYGISAGGYNNVVSACDGHVYDEYDSDSATLDIPNEADARLIAAAPELYEALVGLLPSTFTGPFDEARETAHWEREKSLGNGEAPAVLAAFAAVRKARGEQS